LVCFKTPRYRGQAKVDLQNQFVGAACNVKRWLRLLVTRHLSLSFMCGPHFCSMRITEDVRRYAAEKGLTDEAAISKGLEEKATEFAKAHELYQKI
jgi:hypothetical protein